jgi:glutamate formiminotransferase
VRSCGCFVAVSDTNFESSDGVLAPFYAGSMPLPLESVPNFSEGRDASTLAALEEAMSRPARLLDVHADWDHHRSVFTLVGGGEALAETLAGGIARAVELIDLRRHEGAHPRVGAVDVVPFVPLRPEHEPAAREAAVALAERVGADLGLPVFFYGHLTEDGREPAFFRRGGPEGLQRRVDEGDLRPDRGPDRLHPTAGAVLVGVRRPLIAFNVNLRADDVEVARAIARLVRERDGGFPGVRALGLDLPSAGLVQVSMNVTDWEASALHEIVARIVAEAEARGAEVVGSELVGLMPAGAAVEAAGAVLRIDGFDPRHVLELRLLDD